MYLITRFAKRTVYDLTRPLFLKQMVWAVAFWVFAMGTLKMNIHYLTSKNPDPVRPNDLILDWIPETESLGSLGDIAGFTGGAMIIFVMWQERFKRAPKLIFLLGFMYMMRGFVINLTPLAQMQPPATNYSPNNWLAQNFYYGMFFSGHTASAFTQVFYIKGHRLRPYAAIAAAFQVFTLLAGHHHYSIDIVGGLFVAYFMTHFEFMRLVPHSLYNVKWMPWYSESTAQIPLGMPEYQPAYIEAKANLQQVEHKVVI